MKLDQYMIERIVDVLNQSLKADKRAIHQLVNYQVLCNRKLAENTPVLVNPVHEGLGFDYTTTVLGLINGFINASDERGYIIADTDYGVVNEFRYSKVLDAKAYRTTPEDDL
jgi:hypothetical protein